MSHDDDTYVFQVGPTKTCDSCQELTDKYLVLKIENVIVFRTCPSCVDTMNAFMAANISPTEPLALTDSTKNTDI